MRKPVWWAYTRPKLTHDPDLRREQAAVTRGYIMALEDMMKELAWHQATNPDKPGLADPHKILFRIQDRILFVHRQALHRENELIQRIGANT